ncbi:DMT family transporter [Kosmotoga olearia]|uniref:EamA domain-containing protein n=1 Tax=Kosmotoga olearia (strain ATCC BAA-1733 / DSM 21960 / TBF 19.5.1) TaxID=521045 RepID=C5CIS2_KOSOT|nr:DMT family transporter [Kosmotoga olearia]ACR78913.1 protein of unknown function DUF6 transmembrane [Kosmotoga olearia TBF 19.5.1]
MNKRVTATLLLATTAIIWGESYLFTKVAVESMPPMTLALFRFIVAVAVFIPVQIKKGVCPKRTTKQRFNIAMAGFFGVTLYFLFENYGLRLTSASDASLLVSSAPILTMILYDILHRKFDGLEYLGSTIAFIGISIVIYGGQFSEGSSVLGNSLSFLAALSWAGYTYFFDKVKDSSIATIVQLMVWGIVFITPFSIIEVFFLKDPVIFSVEAVSGVLYLGILASALGYLMWGKGIHLWGGKAATLWVYTIPVFTILGDIIFLKHRPSLFFYVGALLVGMGMSIAIWRQRKHLQVQEENASTQGLH